LEFKKNMKKRKTKSALQWGKTVLRMEAQAILGLVKRIDGSFTRAVSLMLECKGRVIVIGMGKPGFIARKIASTFASTGTPSFYVHPAEAFHGDLGKITKSDVVLILSNSGSTDEVVKLLPSLKKLGVKIISLTAESGSPLGKNSDVVLTVKVKQEACSLNLAPTSSTTASLAMGDALAIALLEARQFKAEDFAFFHPGGNLARRFIQVKDLMRTGPRYPRVLERTPVKQVLLAITRAKAGSCTVVDKKGKLVGIFTDGDLRRHLERDGQSLLRQPVKSVSTLKPLTIREDKLAAEALPIFRERRIDELPVVDKQGRAVGLLDIQDLLRAGFI
jgi:arabinose-5-phosphate isomerase